MMIFREDHQEIMTIFRGDHQGDLQEMMIGTTSEDHREMTTGTILEDHQEEIIGTDLGTKLEETDLQGDSLENLRMTKLEMMVEIGEEHLDKKGEIQNHLLLLLTKLNRKNKNKP